jgi:hypothetical protein
MLYVDDETGSLEAPVESTPLLKSEAPPSFQVPATKSDSPPPVFHPLAYRGVVAEWPIDLREKWGRRANELEESGLTWRDAETQAFIEVWSVARAQQAPPSLETAGQLSAAEQN